MRRRSLLFEAIIDEQGGGHLLADVRLLTARRAFVMILDEARAEGAHETALLSEAALANDWNRPEEDAAWSYLQSAK